MWLIGKSKREQFEKLKAEANGIIEKERQRQEKAAADRNSIYSARYTMDDLRKKAEEGCRHSFGYGGPRNNGSEYYICALCHMTVRLDFTTNPGRIGIVGDKDDVTWLPPMFISSYVGLQFTAPEKGIIPELILNLDYPITVSMPCGQVHVFTGAADVPLVDTPCPCGDPKHWIVRVTVTGNGQA